jgi:hypothetical protein
MPHCTPQRVKIFELLRNVCDTFFAPESQFFWNFFVVLRSEMLTDNDSRSC